MASNAYADAEFAEEVGGYTPREVDKALKQWQVSPPHAAELRDVQFGRAIRGYRRSDVDAFLTAMAAGTKAPPPSPQLGSFVAQTIAGLGMIAPLLLVFSIPNALERGSIVSYAESVAAVTAIGAFGWQWRRGAPGAHERRSA